MLVEADDPNEPISDTLRSLLDGHTWLSRETGQPRPFSGRRRAGQPEPIDVRGHDARASRGGGYGWRELLAVYRDHEDLISIGAYRPGGNRMVDLALHMLEPIQQFLRQAVDEVATIEEAREELLNLGAARWSSTGRRLWR